MRWLLWRAGSGADPLSDSYCRKLLSLDSGSSQECSLQKARYMKKIYAESRATGARVEDLVARDREAEEAAIVKQMGDMADFFSVRAANSVCASSQPRP